MACTEELILMAGTEVSAVRLSNDHKPSDPNELARIQASARACASRWRVGIADGMLHGVG